MIGLVVEANGPEVEVGEVCAIGDVRRGEVVLAQAVGFRTGRTLLMPLSGMQGIRPGAEVVATGRALMAPVGEGLLGRVLDGLGRPIDDKGPLPPDVRFEPVEGRPPSPLGRPPIERRLALGVRALDAVIPCGRGQRLGIFAGSGVGKSTLLGMIARNTAAAVNVIGLVGERGREVREFIERDLGPEGLARSVIVCATSDEPPLVRVTAAFLAMRIAESFRDRGDDVLLMMDSLTRFAMAQREIGLAIGEPPGHARVHAERVRAAAAAARARRDVARRIDHRPHDGARRGRRHERADRGRRARHHRRPRRPRRASSPTATTTPRSTCCRASRGSPRRSRARRRAPRQDGCARCSRRTARART